MAQTYDLGAGVTTNSTSAPMKTPNFPFGSLKLHVIGTGTWRVGIELSVDGISYHEFVAKTADEYFSVPFAPFIRAVYSNMSGAFVTTNIAFLPATRGRVS